MNQTQLDRALGRIIGLTAWRVGISSTTAPVIRIHFGGRLPTPVRGIEVSDRGEFVLMVECPWRLERAAEVVTTSRDDGSQGGRLLTGINQLVDKQLQKAMLLPDSLDLTLVFKHAYVLHVFCDVGEEDKNEHCYALLTPEGSIVVSGARDVTVRN